MRRILFRGKRKDNVWVYGDLIHIDKGYIIITSTDLTIDNSLSENNALCYSEKEFSVVIPETVSQFTGLTDKNGKEIYEGDIIQDNNGIGVIMWFQTSWGVASYAHGYDGLKSYTAIDSFYVNETKEWEIIGNIHDNYELLNKE